MRLVLDGGVFLIHAVSFNQVPAKVVCEVPRGDANGTEDSAPASLRTILQEAEASGLLDLKIFGHSVRRPAGAALSTAEEDYFVIEAEGDADSRWCLRPKAFPEASAVNVNNAADFFSAAQLVESQRIAVLWRVAVDPNSGMLFPKKPLYFIAHEAQTLKLVAGMALRIV